MSFAEHDRVAFHVPDDRPAKPQIGQQRVARLCLRDDFPLALRIGRDIGLLHEHAPFHRPAGERRGGRIERADGQQPNVGLPLRFRGQNLQVLRRSKLGRDDRLDEQARRRQHLGRRRIDRLD